MLYELYALWVMHIKKVPDYLFPHPAAFIRMEQRGIKVVTMNRG